MDLHMLTTLYSPEGSQPVRLKAVVDDPEEFASWPVEWVGRQFGAVMAELHHATVAHLAQDN